MELCRISLITYDHTENYRRIRCPFRAPQRAFLFHPIEGPEEVDPLAKIRPTSWIEKSTNGSWLNATLEVLPHLHIGGDRGGPWRTGGCPS